MHRTVSDDDGLHGQGYAVGKTDQNIPFAFEYNVFLTESWDIKRLGIASLLDDRALAVRHHEGTWYDDIAKVGLPEFDDVRFCDISISPFTNSLPINRLAFEGNREQSIDVVFFDENTFSLRRVRQIYSRTADRTFRYQDVEMPEFTAKIVTDADGLVIDYEHLFKMLD